MKIYKVTNKNNGKVYIGQTSQTLKSRLAGHISALKHKRAYSAAMLADYEAGHKFTIELLNDCEHVFDASNIERYYIKLLKATNPRFGYNLQEGGKDAAAFVNGVAVKNITTGQVFPSLGAAAKSVKASVTTIRNRCITGLAYAGHYWSYYGT